MARRAAKGTHARRPCQLPREPPRTRRRARHRRRRDRLTIASVLASPRPRVPGSTPIEALGHLRPNLNLATIPARRESVRHRGHGREPIADLGRVAAAERGPDRGRRLPVLLASGRFWEFFVVARLARTIRNRSRTAGETERRPSARTGSPRQPIPLTQLRRGQLAAVSEAKLSAPDAELLRAMGLRPCSTVRLCRFGSPCIVQLCHSCGSSCRIGLARDLAERIVVDAHA